jgi:hypothetical protein
MSGSCGERSGSDRRGERGGARLKFLVTIAILAAVAYAGYQYVPVKIKAYQFQVLMDDTVNKAVATGQGEDWIKTQLKGNFADYDVPPDAKITTERREGRMTARVQFTRPLSLPLYNQYDFDYTAKSTDFLTK